MIFLALAFLLILANPQIRFLLLVFPIIILLLIPYIKKKDFIYQTAIFLIIILFVASPYILQVKFETNGDDFKSFIINFPNITLNNEFQKDLIIDDLEKISNEYSNQTFVVRNRRDAY